MKTIEEYFQDSIEQYHLLEEHAQNLADQIGSLKPDEIMQKCDDLHELQKSIATNDANIIEIMKFVGPEVLENPYTGEYQRALQKAIDASDRVANKAKTLKTLLVKELSSLKKGQRTLSGYTAGSKKSGSLVQTEL